MIEIVICGVIALVVMAGAKGVLDKAERKVMKYRDPNPPHRRKCPRERTSHD